MLSLGGDEMTIVPKRELGNGRWDRKLKERMVALSAADNYDEAKHEWIATGEVWWTTLGDVPDWANQHIHKCLCGHDIVYHFEIHNTETDVRECVGSDHINSYMILRAITEETNLDEEAITDEMIEEWITVRVESLKKDAWWKMHGDEFIKMFNAVKDLDLRVNVRRKGRYYDSNYKMYRDKTFVRKASDGKYGAPGYKMASIVWRWNHPDNTKAQQRTKGWPNQKLYNDLLMFYFNVETAKAETEKEDKMLARRAETLEEYAKREARRKQREFERKQKVVNNLVNIEHDEKFKDSCEYYGIKPFVPEQGKDTWEEGFLLDIKGKMIKGLTLTESQVQKLWDILDGDGKIQPATERQKNYLMRLGYKGDLDDISKDEASKNIRRLKGNRGSDYYG
tara:strand:+ start:2504 stop:3688 length:1185 start_codon:yes stop_codon:yes gene_type:complete